MNKELFVYHYFFRQKDPFLTCMELEDFSVAKLVDLKLPMQGYDAHYYEKRLCREEKCRELFISKGGNPKTKYPYYFTLGCQDDLFFRQRHHINSVAIPLSELPLNRVSFTIGDSIGIPFEKLENSLLTYDELIANGAHISERLNSVESGDKYIEVQLWDDEPIKKYRPQFVADTGTLTFISNLVRIGINARRDDYEGVNIHNQMNLCKMLFTLKNNGLLNDWKNMWTSDIDCSVIPQGMIHGIPHSIKTSLFALVLANTIGLSDREALFVSKCAVYHDIGRNIGNQNNHAELSSIMIKKYFKNVEDSRVAELTIKYHDIIAKCNINLLSDRKAVLYAQILHDADSLDYLRFGVRAFTTKYLLLKESLNVFCLACELNLYFLEFNDYGKLLFSIKC